MVNLLGVIDIPLFDLVLMFGLIVALVRWYITRTTNTHKVKFLLVSKSGLEGRMFPAEESLTENRVSLLKRINWRTTEPLDFQKVGGPLNIYYGSRRETIFKATEGMGETSAWLSTEAGSIQPSLIYEETGKLRNMLTVLSSVALKNNWERFIYGMMGFLMGIIIMMLSGMVFPQVF